jgi:hypothetical protein
VSAVTETLPTGYIGLDAAVERIARRENPGLMVFVYRDEAFSAWDKLCKIAPIAARIMTGDGLLRKPDPVQFEGFAGKYWKFASTAIQYRPDDDTRVPGELELNPCPSYELLDEHGATHRGARLVFLESEIEASSRAGAPPEASAEESPPTRRGPPPKYAWDTIREETFRLMDHHGDFSDDDPKWNRQACLEKALLLFCANKFGKDKEPSPSRLRDRDKIPRWLAEWRKPKEAVGN